MKNSIILEILENPDKNGIVVFVLGILLALSVYHFFLFFQNKDKSYLIYSIYTLLIFISNLRKPQNGFIPILIEPFSNILYLIHAEIVWGYNILYFIFAFTFLDLKSFSKKWHKYIFNAIYILCFICILSGISYRLTGNIRIIFINRHLFFMIYIAILSIITYGVILKMDGPLKYYIIVGSLLLFTLSVVSTFLHKLNLIPDESDINYSVFYVGVILENILFSLALGLKQKLILKEKNESQEKLTIQLKENVNLQYEINVQFEEDVASLSKQAKEGKIESLKARYDKELSDLKMASLRSQMNPHFIFNSLNSIKLYIINSEKEYAVYYLNKFSKLIRKILATTQEKVISLSDEMETMELYLNIENIRFNNEIDYSIDIEESIPTDTIKIPGLILQPFIENAIWHGLSSKKKNKILNIKVEAQAQTHIKISIRDNGIGRKKSAEINKGKMHKKRSIGIKLTEERLKNFSKDYKNNYSLEFIDLFDDNDVAIGTNVVLRIPLI